MTVCVETARVLAAVRLFLSEEEDWGLPPELKQHLAACAACAAEAAALDPALLFAPLAASASPEPPVSGRRPVPSVAEDAPLVASAVLDEVRRRARVTMPVPVAPVRSAWSAHRLAQIAAALALTAGLAGLVRWERGRASETAANRPTPPEAVAALLPEPAPARPLIEGVRNPNARVYEFAAASPQEPAVVFVANPNADL